LSNGSKKLSDIQIGRNILEGARNMIAQGSESLIAALKNNYPLDFFRRDVESRISKEVSIILAEQSFTEPVVPKVDLL